MEPRNDESPKVPESRKGERKPRFQIVKLEERIAPRATNTRGRRCDTFHCSRGGGGPGC